LIGPDDAGDSYVYAINSGGDDFTTNFAARINDGRFNEFQTWESENQGLFEYETNFGDWDTVGSHWSGHPIRLLNNGSTTAAFYRSTGMGNVYVATKSNPSGAFGAPLNLGGVSRGPVAAVSRAPGLRDIFVTAEDGTVWTKAFNGSSWLPSQTGWSGLGGQLSGSPVAASMNSTNLVVFGRGINRDVQINAWNGGSWSGWASLGGDTSLEVAAVSYQAGKLDLFVAAPNGKIYTKWWNGTAWQPSTTGWTALELPSGINLPPSVANPKMGQPVVAIVPNERIDVFSVEWNSTAAYVKTWTTSTGWQPWRNLTGSLMAPISVAYLAQFKSYLLVGIGPDRRMYQQSWGISTHTSNPSGNWTPVDGAMLDLTATAVGPNQAQAVGRGADNRIRTRFYSNGLWQ